MIIVQRKNRLDFGPMIFLQRLLTKLKGHKRWVMALSEFFAALRSPRFGKIRCSQCSSTKKKPLRWRPGSSELEHVCPHPHHHDALHSRKIFICFLLIIWQQRQWPLRLKHQYSMVLHACSKTDNVGNRSPSCRFLGLLGWQYSRQHLFIFHPSSSRKKHEDYFTMYHN